MDGKPDRSKRLNEIEKQIQGTVNALIACPSSKALQEKLTQLEEQKAEIEKMPILQPQLKKEHFENYFHWLALRLEHIEDRQTFFHTVIHKVLVYPEKAVIILNMTDEMADPPKREQVEAFMSNVGEVSLYPCPNCTIVNPNPSRFCDICTAPQRSKAISLIWNFCPSSSMKFSIKP